MCCLEQAALTVVMASRGYPGAFTKGSVISGLESVSTAKVEPHPPLKFLTDEATSRIGQSERQLVCRSQGRRLQNQNCALHSGLVKHSSINQV